MPLIAIEWATKQQVAKLWGRSERTVQRWIDEKKRIVLDGKEYVPEQDPGGYWRFKVKLLCQPMTTSRR